MHSFGTEGSFVCSLQIERKAACYVSQSDKLFAFLLLTDKNAIDDEIVLYHFLRIVDEGCLRIPKSLFFEIGNKWTQWTTDVNFVVEQDEALNAKDSITVSFVCVTGQILCFNDLDVLIISHFN